jgi:hypothetical protein
VSKFLDMSLRWERDQDIPVNCARYHAAGVCFALRLHQVRNVRGNCVYVERHHGACTEDGYLFFDGKTFVETVTTAIVSR